MAAFIRTTLLVLGTHLPRTLRARRTLMMLAVAILPAIPAFIVSRWRGGRVDPADIVEKLGWFLNLQVIVPLVALIGGASAVGEEISDRTITYAFTRPISRAGFYLGRFVAALVAIEATLAIGLAAVVFGLRARTEEIAGLGAPMTSSLLVTMLAGGLVYGALFSALGAWVKHPIVAGLAYAFAIEALIANFPGTTQKLALQYHLRCALSATDPSRWADVARETLTELAPAAEAWSTLGWVTAVALALGMFVFSRRQVA